MKDTKDLEEMMALINALKDAEKDLVSKEETLKQAKDKARVLREETVPLAMMELGISELKLSTGEKVTIKQDVYASIPESTRSAAYDWIKKNGFETLIKLEIIVPYARSEREDAIKHFEEIKCMNRASRIVESIHAQTLKAFLREQMSGSSDVPLDIFGATPVWVAKIK